LPSNHRASVDATGSSTDSGPTRRAGTPAVHIQQPVPDPGLGAAQPDERSRNVFRPRVRPSTAPTGRDQ
jgi:hypothetical protein